MRQALLGMTLAAGCAATACGQAVQLEQIGQYDSGIFDESATEITAYDAASRRLFVTNGFTGAVDVLDLSDPTNPTIEFSIDLSAYGAAANSVASFDGVIAAAVEADDTQAPGQAVFFDADGNVLAAVEVGALPDMITFTPDGRFALTANEGEPDDLYLNDPEGSVSVIRLPRRIANLRQKDVRTAGFGAFNAAILDDSVRVFGPGATVAQDLEPEYIAIDAFGTTAYVTLQENNALAIVDIRTATVLDVVGLGFKDHMLPGNEIDASNRDNGINFQNWPTLGMYQPDSIDSFTVGAQTYYVTANEGDARDYDGFSEEVRGDDLLLDATAYPDAAVLQMDENLGRLRVTDATGDFDNDGDIDQIFNYGARSISIWDGAGNQIADTGSQIERTLAGLIPNEFNSTNDENGSFDSRSDDKGPEPEGVEVASLGGTPYAFVGLERVGGVMVYDLSDPTSPEYVSYTTTRDFTGDAAAGTAGNLGPEGLLYIPASDAAGCRDLLVVSYEVSGSIGVFDVVSPGLGGADLNGDGILDIADVFAFVVAFVSDDCKADLNADGVIDGADILAFIWAYSEG